MLVSTNFRLCGMRDEYAETKIIMKKETKGLEDEELNRAITEFNKRVKLINREIREELLLLCLKQKPKWIGVDDIDCIRLPPLGCKSKLPIFERELRRLVPLCVPINTDNIVKNTISVITKWCIFYNIIGINGYAEWHKLPKFSFKNW